MSLAIRQEAVFFAASFLTGVLLLGLYDVLLLLRKLIHHGNWAVNVEDLLYWCVVSLVIFGLMFEENEGALRVYAFAGIVAGAWLGWRLTVYFCRICTKLLKKIKKRGKIISHKGERQI